MTSLWSHQTAPYGADYGLELGVHARLRQQVLDMSPTVGALMPSTSAISAFASPQARRRVT